MKIGDKIRSFRQLKGFSQEYMADKLDISVTAYGNIERSSADITYSRMEEIAKIFNITPVLLLAQTENLASIYNNAHIDHHIVGNNNVISHDKESALQIERLTHQIEKLKLEKEKSEIEVKYLKEKLNIAV